MKLSKIHNSTILENVIVEALSDRQKLGLQILKKMCGDDTDFINDVVKELDPERAATEEHKEEKRQELARWIQTAEKGEVRKGTAFGRPVKVKALGTPIAVMGESVRTPVGIFVIRGMMAEGRFKKIGANLIKYLAKMIGANDDDDESQLVAQALDEYPELVAIKRYAKRADEGIAQDDGFWNVVQRALKSAASYHGIPAPDLLDLKDIMQQSYDIVESFDRGLLTEHVIVETTISKLMRRIGVPVDRIGELLDRHDIEDIDFDVSDVRDSKEREKEMLPKQNMDFADETIKMSAILLRTAQKKAEQEAEVEFEDEDEDEY